MIDLRKFIAVFIIFLIFPSQSFADSKDAFGLNYGKEDSGRIAEFYYKNTPNDVLVPVRLLGSVKSPGLYHIPRNTKFINLLSISGGPSTDADIYNIKIKHASGKSADIDLDDYMDGDLDLRLQHGDTIWVPRETMLFSPNTVTTIAVITGVLGIIVSVLLINNQLKN